MLDTGSRCGRIGRVRDLHANVFCSNILQIKIKVKANYNVLITSHTANVYVDHILYPEMVKVP